MWTYRAEIIEALADHGVRPTSSTPPARVRDFVSDLYRWEIRKLRDQLREGRIPKDSYAARVIGLRRRYLVLSVPLDRWTR